MSETDADAALGRLSACWFHTAEAIFMDGSTPWEVDEALVAFGFAAGPFEMQDALGLDVVDRIIRERGAAELPRRDVPLRARMLELGKLGRKTGAGWYRYPGGGGKVDDPIVADLALEEARFAGIERTDYTADQIRERLLLAMVNEAAAILDERIAQSARDIDLVTVFGYGFPRWRGGLMHYADSLGAQAIVARLDELAREDPVAWKASPVLRQCAENGTAIADWPQAWA